MKTKERLTKVGVLEQVNLLRSKINDYCSMGYDTLAIEWVKDSPSRAGRKASTESMIRDLLMAGTFHLTNVLNLE